MSPFNRGFSVYVMVSFMKMPSNCLNRVRKMHLNIILDRFSIYASTEWTPQLTANGGKLCFDCTCLEVHVHKKIFSLLHLLHAQMLGMIL